MLQFSCCSKMGRSSLPAPPPLAVVREAEKFCKGFEELDAITKETLRDDLNLADVKCFFDTILEAYLRAVRYLPASEFIFQCHNFENNVPNDHDFTLTSSESNPMLCFV